MDPQNNPEPTVPVTPLGESSPPSQAPTTNRPLSKKKSILIAGIVAAVILMICAAFWFIGKPSKATVDNHFRTYWFTLGITNNLSSEDVAGMKTPHDLLSSIYNTDVHYDSLRHNPTNFINAFHDGAGDLKRIAPLFDSSIKNIKADRKSYKALKELQPALDKNAAAYVDLEADFSAQKDLWPKLSKYNGKTDHPLNVVNVARKTPAEVKAIAQTMEAEIPVLQTALNAYQPKTELFKGIKEKYLNLLERQTPMPTLIVRSDGSLSSVLLFSGRVIPDTQIDPAPLDKILDSQLITEATDKQARTALNDLALYIQGSLNVAKGDFNKKAFEAFDTLKPELGDSTYKHLSQVYSL